MTPDQIRNLIEATQSENGGKGRMFEVVFVRRTDSKDGSAKAGDIRILRGRLGVRKGVNGKGMKYSPAELNLITVHEASGGFRNVPLDAVLELRTPDTSKHLVTVFAS